MVWLRIVEKQADVRVVLRAWNQTMLVGKSRS
jgi:hypothetical protein